MRYVNKNTRNESISKTGFPVKDAPKKNNFNRRKVAFGSSRKPTIYPLKDFKPHEAECLDIIVPDWFINNSPVDVSIIVPLFRSQEVIKEQIEKWTFDDDGLSKEIIYVDDNCPNKSYETVIKCWTDNQPNHPIGKIIANKYNSGFGQACNLGAAHALGKYLIFLNADTIVLPNWVKPMIDLFENNSDIGIVGNLQINLSGEIDSAGSEWSRGQFYHIGKHIYQKKHLQAPLRESNAPEDMLQIAEREMVTGACFAIPTSLFNKLKGFDSRYIIGYWEDTDLNMRAKQLGYKIFFTPKSKIYHMGGHSKGGRYCDYNKKVFYENWVNNGALEILNTTSDIDKKDIVVYTAISNNYDNLLEEQVTSGVDFVAYLDNEVKSETWNIRQIEYQNDDPVRVAKIYKMLPHIFFPDKKYSLWIDGNIFLKMPVEKIISKYMKDADLVIHHHWKRKCLYAEAKLCSNLCLDDPKKIREQINRYRLESYPSNAGLAEATIILRKHTPAIQKFNEMWWEEVQKGSRRDQISFNYVANKTGIKMEYFPSHFKKKNSPMFSMIKHHSLSENIC